VAKFIRRPKRTLRKRCNNSVAALAISDASASIHGNAKRTELLLLERLYIAAFVFKSSLKESFASERIERIMTYCS